MIAGRPVYVVPFDDVGAFVFVLIALGFGTLTVGLTCGYIVGRMWERHLAGKDLGTLDTTADLDHEPDRWTPTVPPELELFTTAVWWATEHTLHMSSCRYAHSAMGEPLPFVYNVEAAKHAAAERGLQPCQRCRPFDIEAPEPDLPDPGLSEVFAQRKRALGLNHDIREDPNG